MKYGKGGGIFFLCLKGNYTATFDSPLVTFLMLTFGSHSCELFTFSILKILNPSSQGSKIILN